MENIVYNDYANWIMEKSDLFDKLSIVNSPLLKRYEHARMVIKFLYDKKVETQELSEVEESIFSFGFYYLFEEFEQISLLLDKTYNGDIEAFNINSKTILLYLSSLEFENELYNQFEDDSKSKPLVEMTHEILQCIEKKEDAPESLYQKFDEVSVKVFNELELDFYPVNEIFFDIADEMNLIK